MRTQNNSGFTLIEVMVVVAIVAILAVIAMPSFADQIRKGRRADAVSALKNAQLRLERWRVDHANFAGANGQFPSSDHYQYTITASAATPNNYTITATPQGGQANDLCGTMSITNTAGVIAHSPTDSRCW